MLHKFVRYLFPPRYTVDKLPLLPIRYSGSSTRSTSDKKQWIDLLKRAGLARTNADAVNILNYYPGLGIEEIIKREKRKRRRVPRLIRAWTRFKRLF